jgi:hypothetical protein
MRNSRGFGAILLGVALLASGGCGLISSPQPPLPAAKNSTLLDSQGLQAWRIDFFPDLSTSIKYLAHPMFTDAVLTVFTQSNKDTHWHQLYTTGHGLIQSRQWEGGPQSLRGARFAGKAKVVLTWKTGTHPHQGYAVYRIRILKHVPSASTSPK